MGAKREFEISNLKRGGLRMPRSIAGPPHWRVLMLRCFFAPIGVMVNSQGLPAPGSRSHSGPRG